MVNVIVLFSKLEEAKSIKNLLVRNGIDVTDVCTTGAQAAQIANILDDGILVCGYRFPDMIYSELMTYIPDCIEMIVVAGKNHYEECKESEIVCLTMPLKASDFVDTINVTVDKILRQRKIRKSMPKVRSEEDKNVILAAKLKLMEERGYTEEEVHRYLQKKSMDSGVNMVELAYMIINASADS